MNNDATPAFPWHRDGQAAPKVPTLKQNARRFSSSMTMRNVRSALRELNLSAGIDAICFASKRESLDVALKETLLEAHAAHTRIEQ